MNFVLCQLVSLLFSDFGMCIYVDVLWRVLRGRVTNILWMNFKSGHLFSCYQSVMMSLLVFDVWDRTVCFVNNFDGIVSFLIQIKWYAINGLVAVWLLRGFDEFFCTWAEHAFHTLFPQLSMSERFEREREREMKCRKWNKC